MPREGPIPMLMGYIYKKLGKKDNAHKFFSIALDLESKDTQRIKELIESLHSSHGESGEEVELWGTHWRWAELTVQSLFNIHI